MSEIDRALQLADLLMSLRAQKEAAEEQLRIISEHIRSIEQESLPALMEELGLSAFRMRDGSQVQLTEDVHANISEERREAAHRWLIANGHGGLIKTQVIVGFDRGAVDDARKLASELACDFVDVQSKEAIHPATLKSFVKEQIAAGAAIPFDLLGVRPFNKATITKGKKP